MSQGTREPADPQRPELFLTAAYELWLDGVEEGSKQAEDIRVQYTALARGATKDAVQTFRRWKKEGTI